MFWTSLAVELRDMILISLIQTRGSIAHLASVCREWQAVIERENFSRLKLTLPRLTAFKDIATPKRSYVEYFRLCIDLQEYDCSECERDETEIWWENNTEIVRDAIREAFGVLSKWNREGCLTLDISVQSPSESEHHLKYVRFESDALLSLVGKQSFSSFHDPRHGWVNGTQVSLPSVGSIDRPFVEIEMEPEFWERLPEVTAVTNLLLRRQTRRRWEPLTLKEFLKLLPNLQEIWYEPWKEESRLSQRIFDNNCQSLFRSLVSSGLKKMVVFEDFNDSYISTYQGVHEALDAERVRNLHSGVTKAVTEISLTLEHLSVAFIMDAGLFLNVCESSWVWKELASLTLTCRQLVPDGDLAEINDTLQTAAKGSKRMPSLDSLELWNGGGAGAFACVFKYQASKYRRPARITWRANFDLPLKPEVIRSCEVMVQQRAPCEFQVTKELLGANAIIKSHGDAVRVLELSQQVARPVSLRQIQYEHSL